MTLKSITIRTLLTILLTSALSACGKYSPPFYPEQISPVAVKDLIVTSSGDGVQFSWAAPDKDLRGKELKQIDGYKLMRRELADDREIADEEAEFETVGTIEDTHLAELKKLKDAAIESGKSTRKVKVPEETTKFKYTDTTVQGGVRYLYKLVPINQGDVEGEVTQLVRVLYRGDTSDVLVIPWATLEESEI